MKPSFCVLLTRAIRELGSNHLTCYLITFGTGARRPVDFVLAGLEEVTMEDAKLFWTAFWGVLEVGGGMAGMLAFVIFLYELTKR